MHSRFGLHSDCPTTAQNETNDKWIAAVVERAWEERYHNVEKQAKVKGAINRRTNERTSAMEAAQSDDDKDAERVKQDWQHHVQPRREEMKDKMDEGQNVASEDEGSDEERWDIESEANGDAHDQAQDEMTDRDSSDPHLPPSSAGNEPVIPKRRERSAKSSPSPMVKKPLRKERPKIAKRYFL